MRELRPGSVIKDEAVPTILCQHRNATFVTTNVSDFWRRAPAHARYCIVCVPTSQGQSESGVSPAEQHIFLLTWSDEAGAREMEAKKYAILQD